MIESKVLQFCWYCLFFCYFHMFHFYFLLVCIFFFFLASKNITLNLFTFGAFISFLVSERWGELSTYVLFWLVSYLSIGILRLSLFVVLLTFRRTLTFCGISGSVVVVVVIDFCPITRVASHSCTTTIYQTDHNICCCSCLCFEHVDFQSLMYVVNSIGSFSISYGFQFASN